MDIWSSKCGRLIKVQTEIAQIQVMTNLYIQEFKNNSNFYSDSVYNADKTQKLKYEVYGIEEGDSDAIILELCNLELDDKTFNPEYKVPLAKIKIGKKQVFPQKL